MSRTTKLLSVINEHIRQDNDFVLLITGDEGNGKSRLGLKILDFWITEILQKEIEPTHDVKRLAPNPTVWSEMLRQSGKYDLVGFDEGGQINSRNAMGKFNKMIHEAYQIIRGRNFFSILVIPSVFDIDQSFPKRRAKGLIHVYKRGCLAFYSQDKLRKIIALNQSRLVKTVRVVKPTFIDKFSDYKGVMLKEYLKSKEEHMQRTLDNMTRSIFELSGEDPIDLKISELKEQGMTNKEIGAELGISHQAVSKRFVKIQRANLK